MNFKYLIFFIFLSVFGCSKNENRLIGNWELISDMPKDTNSKIVNDLSSWSNSYIKKIEFTPKDCNIILKNDSILRHFEYKLSGDKKFLTIPSGGDTLAIDYIDNTQIKLVDKSSVKTLKRIKD